VSGLLMLERLIAAVVVLLIAGTAEAGGTLDRVTARGELRVVMVDDYPPFSFINEKKEMDGFDADVARALAEKIGVRPIIETPPWDKIVSGEWNGRWDMCVCSMTPTKERAEYLDFPARYYSSPAVLVVRAGDGRFKRVEDISGKRIAVQAGTSYEEYLRAKLVIPGSFNQPTFPFDNVIVTTFESERAAFNELARDGDGRRVDGVITNLVAAKTRVAATKTLKLALERLYAEPNWIAVEKGDPEWAAKARETVGRLRADGTLTAVALKWVGVDISQ